MVTVAAWKTGTKGKNDLTSYRKASTASGAYWAGFKRAAIALGLASAKVKAEPETDDDASEETPGADVTPNTFGPSFVADLQRLIVDMDARQTAIAAFQQLPKLPKAAVDAIGDIAEAHAKDLTLAKALLAAIEA